MDAQKLIEEIAKDCPALSSVLQQVVAMQPLQRVDKLCQTILITLANGEKKVIKLNYGQREQILKESQNYQQLAKTPLGKYMPMPELVDVERGVLMLPYIDAIPLRPAVQHELVQNQIIADVFAKALELKTSWWSQQAKLQKRSNISSTQRNNWQKVIQNMALALEPLAKENDLSIEQFLACPVVVAGEARSYSLNQAITLISEFLEQKFVYSILTHGDLNGGNLLIEPATGNWHIIDPEFFGYSDPAESYVKLTKYETSDTIQKVIKNTVEVKNGFIYIHADVQFSNITQQLHATGLAYAPIMAAALQDPDFLRRYKLYLTANYMRELASTLVVRKNRPEHVFFAIKKIIVALNLCCKSVFLS